MGHLEALSKIAKVMKENSRMTLTKIIKKTGLPKNIVKECLKDLESGRLIYKINRGRYEIALRDWEASKE